MAVAKVIGPRLIVGGPVSGEQRAVSSLKVKATIDKLGRREL
jgi:hypothetical protein